MRKRNKFRNIKKIVLFLVIPIFLLVYAFNYMQAESRKEEIKSEKIQQEKIRLEKKEKLIKKINLFFQKNNKKSNIEQKEFYSKLLVILEKYKKNISNNKNLNNKFNSEKNLEKINNKIFLINIIIKKITEKNNSIKINKINFIKSQTLILKFTNNIILNNKIIEKNKNNIIKNISVFIFRNKVDLKKNTILKISEKIKKINPKILLFIDQEGGLINRYVDFENTGEINKFFSKNNKYNFLENKLSKLDDAKIKIIRNIFPKKYGYYPSLEIIGKTYDKFKNKEEAKIFLDIVAFIRLQTLKNSGINTYGLVLDLNRGNPVISGNKRSFSKHLWKYKLLADSFIKAGKNIEIFIYAKHFPGHGAGLIDSHKGILNLSKNTKYLEENLDLFKYFIKNSGELQVGLMVGHIYFSNILEDKFNKIISDSDFLITDDLAMGGYKKASGKKIKNQIFSTDLIINKNNLIIVDTVNIAKIK